MGTATPLHADSPGQDLLYKSSHGCREWLGKAATWFWGQGQVCVCAEALQDGSPQAFAFLAQNGLKHVTQRKALPSFRRSSSQGCLLGFKVAMLACLSLSPPLIASYPAPESPCLDDCISIQHVLSVLHPCSPLQAGPFAPYACPFLSFLSPCCLFSGRAWTTW